MKTHAIRNSSILLLTALTAVAAGAQSSMLTLQQARQKVKSTAAVTDGELAESRSRAIGSKLVHQFKTRGGDTYRVDAESGRVAVVYGSRFSQRSRQEIEADQLALDRLEQIARDAARERFSGGDAQKLELRNQPQFDGKAYEFILSERLPSNGAWTDNGCIVGVGADTGEIISYSDRLEKIPGTAHSQPRIPVAQAVAVAARNANLPGGKAVGTPALTFSKGKLFWSIELEGPQPGEPGGRGLSYVDALTGEVLFSAARASASPRPKKPSRDRSAGSAGFVVKQTVPDAVPASRAGEPASQSTTPSGALAAVALGFAGLALWQLRSRRSGRPSA